MSAHGVTEPRSLKEKIASRLRNLIQRAQPYICCLNDHPTLTSIDANVDDGRLRLERNLCNDSLLPNELWISVISLLPLEDRKMLCLCCQRIRQLVLPSLEIHCCMELLYSYPPKGRPTQSKKCSDCLTAFKRLDLDVLKRSISSITTPFGGVPIGPQLAQYLDTLRTLPIRKFSLGLTYEAPKRGRLAFKPVPGLSNLESLRIEWHGPSPLHGHGGVASLHELLRPSLASLVEVSINLRSVVSAPYVDLRLMEAASATLRVLRVWTSYRPCNSLCTAAELFPNLRELRLFHTKYGEPLVWTDDCAQAVQTLKEIRRLYLSFPGEDTGLQTLHDRTHALALACPNLAEGEWADAQPGSYVKRRTYSIARYTDDAGTACVRVDRLHCRH